jgi:NH3-dependent NAD+ synthetase
MDGCVIRLVESGEAGAASLQDVLDHLGSYISRLQRVVVAFSGGVDSSLVLKIALDVLGPEKVLAATGSLAADAQPGSGMGGGSG